jgi:hypothetical protein
LIKSRERLGLTTTGFTVELLKSAKPNTNDSANMYAKLMFYFLALIKDYDSMHMFSEASVKSPPAVKARSIVLLLRFKDEKLKVNILKDENNQVVLDCFGNPITICMTRLEG